MKTLYPSPGRTWARKLTQLAPLLACLLGTVGAASAATLNVPADQPTIQAAITAASSGDTISIAAGTYTGMGNVDLDTGGKNLTIQSVSGAASTIIDCGGSSSVDHRGFSIYSGETVSITGLTIKNGYESSYPGGGVEIYNSNVTMTNCIVSGNTVVNGGGGIYSVSDGSNNYTTTLTNCLISGNIAAYGGGIASSGVFYPSSSNSITTITNCTFSGNTASNGSGGIYSYSDEFGGSSGTGTSTTTVTNCILYGDNGGEILDSNSNGTLTVAYSDVQGSYTGTGNISTDPLFVSATDFHLQPSSQALGAGTASGAPTTTIDGKTRPTPPSIGAFELALPTHVLWDNTSGAASIWNYSTTTGTFTQNTYGPYPNWTAKTVADGPDGFQRVLWDNNDGTASIWNLNNSTAAFSQFSFGPYAGWTAKALSVGTDNTTHVLWDNVNGTASLWNYSTASGMFTQNTYGPYPGWTATALADGPDGQTRLLWDNTNGTASIWSLNNTTAAFTQFSFGPYAGWTAAAVSVGMDNTTHVLWDNVNGTASVWNYSTGNGTFTQNTYGPYPGWMAKGLADGGDGKVRLLWDNTNGTASLWSLNNVTGLFGQFSFGPYAGWMASGVSGS